MRAGAGPVVGALVLAQVLAAAAAAQELELRGEPVQGGLMVGRVAPGSAVRVDGRAVRVSPQGLFLAGFGRDAAPRAEVRVTHPDGRRTRRALRVRQRQYPVQRIDGLAARQVTPAPQDLARILADGARIEAVRARDSGIAYFATGFAWPAEGPTSGVFGSRRILNGEPRRPHSGLDIAAPAGATVRAAAVGVVALAREDMFFTGQTVMIDHGHGLASVYAHMSAILVAEGARVGRGQAIGRVGASGRASGPHLHWGVSLFDTHLDPALLVGGE